MKKRFLFDSLEFRLKHFPAICILGVRQVGKTSLVKELVRNSEKETIYLDLENPEDEIKLQSSTLFLKAQSGKTVIIDEIQRKPTLFPVLRSLIDMDRKPGRFILLGSASPDIFKESAESLAGRISYIYLHPFILDEAGGDWKDLWVRGGFPVPYLENEDKVRRVWFNDFIQTYFQKDLPQMGLPANPPLLYRLFQMLAATQANLLNIQSLSKSLQISHTTLARYFYFLENAFLLVRLQPYSTNIPKRLVKTPKCYIMDSGLVHSMLLLYSFEQVMGHPIAGFTFEGMVFQHLQTIIENDTGIYFYRTHDGAEIDFVLEKGGKIVLAVEAKLSNTPEITRGTTIALQDLGNPPLLLVTPEASDFPLKEQIFVCSIATLTNNIRAFLK
jgi:predicted AAA+ superfamily ATPase